MVISTNDYAGHPSTDPQDVVDAANAAIRDYCGWHVAPVIEETVEVESDGSGVVFLPTLRIVDLVSVEVGGAARVVRRSDWSRNGWLRVHAGVGAPVVVTMRHGFEATASLKTAALGLAAMGTQAPDGRMIARQRLGDRDVTYYTPTQMTDVLTPGDPRVTLNRYRLPTRP